MASIKQLDERRYKIPVSNGYRPNGKKISKAKTIQVPPGVPKRGIGQYVVHAAEELERSFKTGYAEDGEMTFEEFASRWLKRQTKYAPSTIAAYRRMLEVVYPMIGGIRLNKLRPMALENMLSALRKRKHHGKLINESTAQRYLSVVSAVLSDAKRNEIIEKNPARMLDLPTPQRTVQRIPTRSEVEKLLDALVIAPCTGNTLAKLAHGITDTAVTMAAKSHLRCGRPVVIAFSTNDGLSASAKNIGELLNRKHYYFVPFGQDDPEKKPTSLAADFELIGKTVEAALEGKQLQTLLLK